MSISRKKVTTTTTVEEEFDSSEVQNSTDAPSSNVSTINQTGDKILSETPARTSTPDTNTPYGNKVGKTWSDLLYALSVGNNSWFDGLMIVMLYGGAYYITMEKFHECSLLVPKNWLWLATPLMMGTIVSAIYLIVRYCPVIIKKIRL